MITEALDQGGIEIIKLDSGTVYVPSLARLISLIAA
jgi:hypothetical protein